MVGGAAMYHNKNIVQNAMNSKDHGRADLGNVKPIWVTGDLAFGSSRPNPLQVRFRDRIVDHFSGLQGGWELSRETYQTGVPTKLFPQ